MEKSVRICLGILAVLISPLLSGCIGSDVLGDLGLNRGIPGGLTLACLDDSTYTSMVVEIDYQPGYQPESSSTDLLQERLESVCDKPQGIDIKFTETTFENEAIWSADDVRNSGWDAKSEDPRDGSTLYWQVIFPAGVYEDDSVLVLQSMPRPLRSSKIQSMMQRISSVDPLQKKLKTAFSFMNLAIS